MLKTIALLPLLSVVTSALPFFHIFHIRSLFAGIPNHPPALLLYATGKAPNVPIENSLITASDRGFYINHPTVGLPCPESAHCNLPTNTTAIVINPDTTARLYSAGPSGNQIYVNASSGALTYNPTYGTNTTLANFTSSPGGNLFKDPGRADYHTNHTAKHSDDIAKGFAATTETLEGKRGIFAFHGKSDGSEYADLDEFWACPTGEEDPDDVYRVFVGGAGTNLAKTCFGIEIATRNLTSEVASEVAWGY